jgi:CubicO group peptidase (beta-lactamase class C family)
MLPVRTVAGHPIGSLGAVIATLLLASAAWAQSSAGDQAPSSAPVVQQRSISADGMSAVVAKAAALPALRSIIVARDGRPVLERAFKGGGLDDPVNVKSISKTIIAALVGAAIDREVLPQVHEPVAPLLRRHLPQNPDPRLGAVTIEHLLTMQSGLERTSGGNYGRWVSSPDWVRFALSRPFVDEPGGRMLYSTGNSHLLSAILTQASSRSTLALAREWLGEPLRITIPPWTRDRQGIFLGGNNMALSPRALLRFGEMYRNGGVFEGRRVLSQGWIEASWTPRTESPFTGHQYGYGWFIAEMNGQTVYYAWGYGGQMLYVVPRLGLTVVMSSDPDTPSGRSGYVRDLHSLLTDGIIGAALAQDEGRPAMSKE